MGARSFYAALKHYFVAAALFCFAHGHADNFFSEAAITVLLVGYDVFDKAQRTGKACNVRDDNDANYEIGRASCRERV